MFIKKDLRKIPKILEDAIDCSHEETSDGTTAATTTTLDNNGSNNITKRVKHTEPLKSLKLARRQHEFQGSVKILCEPSKRSSYVPKLKQLELLNLYDCNISNLDGIGDVFNSENTPNLTMINLGRNPLRHIPMEFSNIQSIQHLWLDDCHELTGQFPKALLELTNLESLRMPNCKINVVDLSTGVVQEEHENESANTATSSSNRSGRSNNRGRAHRDDGDDDDSDDGSDIDTGDDDRGGHQQEVGLTSSSSSSSSLMVIKPLKFLKILNLDRNELTELPSRLGEWAPNLEELYVRHNKIQSLKNVESFPSKLKILHLSSNQLEDLDAFITTKATANKQLQQQQVCPELKHLSVNGNQLKSIPDGILGSPCCCPKLERFVICHNPPLTELPEVVWEHIHNNSQNNENEDDQEQEGDDSNKKNCMVVWEPNPNIVVPSPANVL